MASWTTAQIPDQTGRTVVVTGANTGLGAATARALAAAGAQVVLACRNTAKADAAAATMSGDVRVESLDLADLASVRAFAQRTGEIDVLVNNAGVMAIPFARTADGFEMQIGTNHLGHFALTGLLLDRIRGRVVTVASVGHRIGRIDLDDLSFERRPYRRWTAYGQSKLANLMFTYELQRRLDAAGSPVHAMAAHPGYSSTDLQSHTNSAPLHALMVLGNVVLGQSADMGALPILFAATDPAAQGGAYYGPNHLGGLRGYPSRVPSSRASHDLTVAADLWALSQKLTGVSAL
jgi:NAD(P)-dependent dehydrogenase (short-subunit alcohol dehydrogenase family)